MWTRRGFKRGRAAEKLSAVLVLLNALSLHGLCSARAGVSLSCSCTAADMARLGVCHSSTLHEVSEISAV